MVKREEKRKIESEVIHKVEKGEKQKRKRERQNDQGTKTFDGKPDGYGSTGNKVLADKVKNGRIGLRGTNVGIQLQPVSRLGKLIDTFSQET